MSQQYLAVTGRVLLSLIFVLSALSKITDWDATAQYAATRELPLIPALLVAAIAVELAGGFSLLLGWYARWGAWLLFFYLIPTTLVFHNFWALDGLERQTEVINLLKNLAIMGGLLLVVVNDWAVSVTQRNADVVRAESTAAPLRRAMGYRE